MSKVATRVINEALVVPVTGSGYTPVKMTWTTNFIDREGTAPVWAEPAPVNPVDDFVNLWSADDQSGMTLNGSDVDSWNGGTKTLVPPPGSTSPSLTTVNGKDAVYFDGVDESIRVNYNHTSGEWTVMAAFTNPTISVGTDQYPLAYSSGNAGVMYRSGNPGLPVGRTVWTNLGGDAFQPWPANADNKLSVHGFRVTGQPTVTNSQFQDGTPYGDSTDSRGPGTLGFFGYGAQAFSAGTTFAEVYIHEVLVYERALSDQEIVDVTAYLTEKWGG